MSSQYKKCVVDTNVPIIANMTTAPGKIPIELADCVMRSVEFIQQLKERGGLVLDDGEEIFNEYKKHLLIKGQPGVGDAFMKWIHDYRWLFPATDRVKITKRGDSYDEFPQHEKLVDFDLADRKFIAVANAHKGKPPVIQATDCKWWGWKDALSEVGIKVHFVSPEYVEVKYKEKMGKAAS